MSGETVYVRGEGTVVRLTQVAAGQCRDLAEYFGGLQEARLVGLRCSETLADNLKIEVIAGRHGRHGRQGQRSVPFYIVEYDAARDGFCVWRSDGKWGGSLNSGGSSNTGTHKKTADVRVRTNLARNKRAVRAQLQQFCSRMVATQTKNSLENITEAEELSSSSSVPSPSYSIHVVRQLPRSTQRFEIGTTKQITDNFNMLFRPIVENFEDVYLDKYPKNPRKCKVQRKVSK